MKCPKCGYDNLAGGTKCGKCGSSLLTKQKISCPKCATINSIEDKRCKKCGYRLNRKGHLLFNLFLSILFVGLLFVLLYFDKISWLTNINKGFKIFSLFVIVILVAGTLLFRRNDALDRNIPELKVVQANFRGLKFFSEISLTVLSIVLIVIAVYMAVKYLY